MGDRCSKQAYGNSPSDTGSSGYFLPWGRVFGTGHDQCFAQTWGCPIPDTFGLYHFHDSGYTCGVLFIPKYLSQTLALVVSTLLGIAVTLLILLLRGPVSIYLVPVLGLADALLYYRYGHWLWIWVNSRNRLFIAGHGTLIGSYLIFGF